MKLIEIQSGREVKVGDMVSTFRNELVSIEHLSPPHKPSSSGKVLVRGVTGWEQEFCPGVIGCKFVDVVPEPMPV